MRPRGIVPILHTPFDEQGNLDESSLRREVGWCIERGAAALGTGMASETFTLTDDERLRTTEVVSETVDGAVPFIVSCGGDGTRAAVERAERLADAGADALLLVPPTLVPLPPNRLTEYVTAVAETGLPVVLQDVPALTNVAMPASWLAERVAEVPNIVGTKIETSPPLGKVTDVRRAAPDAAIYGGAGGMLFVEEIRRGADGSMPGPVGLTTFVRTFDGIRENAPVEDDHLRLAYLTRYMAGALDLFIWGTKQLLADAGVLSSATMRMPTPTVDERSAAELRALADPAFTR